MKELKVTPPATICVLASTLPIVATLGVEEVTSPVTNTEPKLPVESKLPYIVPINAIF